MSLAAVSMTDVTRVATVINFAIVEAPLRCGGRA